MRELLRSRVTSRLHCSCVGTRQVGLLPLCAALIRTGGVLSVCSDFWATSAVVHGATRELPPARFCPGGCAPSEPSSCDQLGDRQTSQLLHAASLFRVLCASVKSQQRWAVRQWEGNFKSRSPSKRISKESSQCRAGWAPGRLGYSLRLSAAICGDALLSPGWGAVTSPLVGTTALRSAPLCYLLIQAAKQCSPEAHVRFQMLPRDLESRTNSTWKKKNLVLLFSFSLISSYVATKY